MHSIESGDVRPARMPEGPHIRARSMEK